MDPARVEVLAGQGALSEDRANGMIENVVGRFEMPIGVATNFLINGRDYLVPMAVEEPSVVAAASHMAKIARQAGGFRAETTAPVMRAQIQILGLDDLDRAEAEIEARKQEILARANACDPVLVSMGGGCCGIEVQRFDPTPVGPMLVLHLLVDVRDAMGANTVNTMAETLAPFVEQITGGRVRLRILSNLADQRLARAEVALPFDVLGKDGEALARGIVEAAALALFDPYRAATHNKGIMNGVDAVVLATGNDWRAVEAGAHAYAARDGRYLALSNWTLDNGALVGRIELPMALGLVGGATKSHPAAQAAVDVLGVATAAELAEVVTAVGLAQNLGALRALAGEGIQRGHMALHARTLAMSAGATGSDIDRIADLMVTSKEISATAARRLLKENP